MQADQSKLFRRGVLVWMPSVFTASQTHYFYLFLLLLDEKTLNTQGVISTDLLPDLQR